MDRPAAITPMPADHRSWDQKNHWILASLLLLPPLGIVLVWRSRWPRVVKRFVLGFWALLLLAALTGSPDEPPQVTTAPAAPQSIPPSQPVSESTSLSAEPAPANMTFLTSQPIDIEIKPEHKSRPVVVPDSEQYMALTHRIGGLGQMQAVIVDVGSGEEIPVQSNCLDIREMASRADVLVGEFNGRETYFNDYAPWILRAAQELCSAMAEPVLATEGLPLDEPAMLVSEDAGAQINVRAEPSQRATAINYGYAGDLVTLLKESPGEDGLGWYEVRFDGTGVTGWVRSDFVTRDLMDAPAVISESAAPSPSAPPVAGSTAPVRSAYTGTCDCPYDLKSNGELCGAGSAYSRPGGRAPICYVNDQ